MNYMYLYGAIAFVLATILFPIVLLISLQWYRSYSVPQHIPWAGLKNKWLFPKLRASLREVTARRNPMNEGYQKYSKHGEAFVLPGLQWPDVVLPPSNVSWMVSQPEHMLSATKVQNDILGLSYLSHGPDLNAIIDFSVIRRDLTRNLSKILPEVIEEIELCFDEKLESEAEQWKDVNIVEIIESTSRRLNNRLFIGLPLCRDQRYIKGLRTWEIGFGICSALIRYFVPDPIKPWFAPVLALPVQIQAWRLKRLLLPIIRQRLVAQEHTLRQKSDNELPNDVLQWLINGRTDRASASSRMSLSDIAGKAIELNFFSVHTVAINCISVLTDILCFSSAAALIAELRDEAELVMPRLASDPRAIRDMVKMDSVIRDSLRLHSMGSRALGREVVASGGLTTPDGLHLPQGTHVCALGSSMHQDADVWGNALEFRPMRFMKPVEGDDVSANKPRSAVHVTEDFLSFGLGQHACPGRFFAVQALKVLLGHLVMHYEIEPLAERPKFLELGEAVVPSDKMSIRMRRRCDRPE